MFVALTKLFADWACCANRIELLKVISGAGSVEVVSVVRLPATPTEPWPSTAKMPYFASGFAARNDENDWPWPFRLNDRLLCAFVEPMPKSLIEMPRS